MRGNFWCTVPFSTTSTIRQVSIKEGNRDADELMTLIQSTDLDTWVGTPPGRRNDGRGTS